MPAMVINPITGNSWDITGVKVFFCISTINHSGCGWWSWFVHCLFRVPVSEYMTAPGYEFHNVRSFFCLNPRQVMELMTAHTCSSNLCLTHQVMILWHKPDFCIFLSKHWHIISLSNACFLEGAWKTYVMLCAEIVQTVSHIRL